MEALGLVVTITNEATLGPSSSSQGNFPMNMEGVEGQQYDQQQQDPQQQPYLQQQPDCATEEDKKKDTLTWTSYALSIKGQIPPPPENVFQSRQQQSASLFSENTKSDLSPSSSDLSLCEADSEAEPDVPTFDFANGDVSNYWDYLAFLCLNKSPLGNFFFVIHFLDSISVGLTSSLKRGRTFGRTNHKRSGKNIFSFSFSFFFFSQKNRHFG